MKDTNLKIPDALGRVIYWGHDVEITGKLEKTISLKQQSPGIYYLNLRSDEGGGEEFNFKLSELRLFYES